VVLVWFASPSERRRRGIVDRLEVGDPADRVEELMGVPGARCRGGDLEHLDASFPLGWPAASVATTLQTLGEETRDRWVYPLSSRREAGCAPADRQTEIGFDAEGRVLWLVGIMGESPLRLPDRFTPATPAP
jgi:hypothetical protein